MSALTIEGLEPYMPKSAVFTGPDAVVSRKVVTVICPECEGHVEGVIEACQGFPFANYDAHCQPCDNWIMEDEWEEVGEEQ